MEIKDLHRTALSNEGEWVDDIPGMGDLRLKVRADSSDAVVKAQARKMRAVPRKLREEDGTPKFEVLKRITYELFFEVVLVDWDGLTDNGVPVPYSKELAQKWLSDPSFVDFADAVAWASRVAANRRHEALEANAGN